MIRLSAPDYAKAEEPLQKVKINTLFAQAVIRGRVPGEVYADDSRFPAAFYIVHPSGMSLLFGETDRLPYNRKLIDYVISGKRARTMTEWLQVTPVPGVLS
ncbi:hypothetical protein [Paenibacillus rhizophilus]|nr:hypothetical protein [Paenibacillus rhizophilus]